MKVRALSDRHCIFGDLCARLLGPVLKEAARSAKSQSNSRATRHELRCLELTTIIDNKSGDTPSVMNTKEISAHLGR
jgi:hypothetical protein